MPGQQLAPAPAREAILANAWKRSAQLGIRPELDLNTIPQQEIDPDRRLYRSVQLVIEQLALDLEDEPVGIIITDRHGVILGATSGHRAFRSALVDVRAEPGVSYSEEVLGTNAVGTAIESRVPVAIRGQEHYIESMREFACFAWPFAHPRTGRLLGAVNMCAHVANSTSLHSVFVKHIARQVSTQYRDRTLIDSLTLLERYEAAYEQFGGAVLALSADATYLSREATGVISPADLGALREVVDQGRVLVPGTVFRLPSGLAAESVAAASGGVVGAVLRVLLQPCQDGADAAVVLPVAAGSDVAAGWPPTPPEPAGEGARGMEQIEREAIVAALRRSGGDKSAAARALGLSRRTIYNKIARLRIRAWEYAD